MSPDDSSTSSSSPKSNTSNARMLSSRPVAEAIRILQQPSDIDDSDNETSGISNSITDRNVRRKLDEQLLFPVLDIEPKKIPSKADRRNLTSEQLQSKDAKRYMKMISLLSESCKKAIETLCPGEAFHDVVYDISQKLVEDKIFESKKNESNSKSFNKLSSTLISCLEASPHASIQKRTLSAVAVKGFSDVDKIRIDDMHPNLKLSKHGKGRIRSYNDYNALSTGKVLEKTSITHCRMDNNVLQDAVKFILSDDYCAVTSWGTRMIRFANNEIAILPKVIRKHSRPATFESYERMILSTNAKGCGRTTFYQLMRYISSGDQAILKGLDYVTTRLVTEPVELLQDIIHKAMNGKDEVCDMTKKLVYVKNFVEAQMFNSY